MRKKLPRLSGAGPACQSDRLTRSLCRTIVRCGPVHQTNTGYRVGKRYKFEKLNPPISDKNGSLWPVRWQSLESQLAAPR
eukprot:3038035-Rhodomonas_salina.2